MLLQVVEAFPWKELGGLGIGGVLLWVLVFVMKNSREQHRECNVTIEKVTTSFAETVKSNSDTFAKTAQDNAEKFRETAVTLLRDAREYHERREDKIMERMGKSE